jgi:hypothetical protein
LSPTRFFSGCAYSISLPLARAPFATEEGELIRLSIRRDGAIVAATFRKAWRTIAEGKALSDIDLLELALIANAFRTFEPRPRDADLLERYLDQRAPDWRQQAAAAAADEEEEQAPQPPPAQPMTREQALEILGLKDGATAEDIKAAFNRLIMRLHPDTGGTDFLTRQLYEARRVLLG